MNKFAIAAALPFALTLAACGDNEVDGTDTTSMEAETVEPMDVGTSDPVDGTAPMDDPMMQEPMTDDMATDPAMDPATPTPE
ncbi:MAG: hypothetical protein KKE77_13455 [Alphaproteobacteria bacterium]|nr:hypothetical protein [Alphaproteobacteria bacterium]